MSNAIEQSRPLIESRRHSLTLRTDALQSPIEGDRTRLVQLIVNLLNNAAKYTLPGCEITVSVRAQDGLIEIEVADTGIGIDGELLPRIFDLFTQAKRTPDRAQGGLGVGLSLVKTIVALHRGSITAVSGESFCLTRSHSALRPLNPLPALGLRSSPSLRRCAAYRTSLIAFGQGSGQHGRPRACSADVRC